jgi:hypothetical protein
MNCEDFKKNLEEYETESPEMLAHMQDCAECSSWLDRELSSPPEGITPAEWTAATARCMPDISSIANKPDNIEIDGVDGFWSLFFSGLRYGVVFGLSIIVGFALFGPRQHEPATFKPQEIKFLTELTLDFSPTIALKSFLNANNSELSGFLDPVGSKDLKESGKILKDFDLSGVTFLEFSDSNSYSFIEKGEIPSFIEGNLKEEYPWNES